MTRFFRGSGPDLQDTLAPDGRILSSGKSEMKEPYKIYRDPLPGSQPGRRSKYPFAQMKVGDCFYVQLKQLKSQNALASAARQWAKRNSKDWWFVTRVVDGMVGLWRVA
jgi:hypothetical protein